LTLNALFTKHGAMPARLSRLALLLLVGGCVAPAAEPPAPPPAAPAPPRYSPLGLESVIGRTAQHLEAQFGRPKLDVREGPARKLQFSGPICVLDAYLYPPRAGGEPIVTHVDARLSDGRDIDRASCVAALHSQKAR
jgi:hypothetical protein